MRGMTSSNLFTRENERLLLNEPRNKQVTDDDRGRRFEWLVIWRLQRNPNQTKTNVPGLTIPTRRINLEVKSFLGKSTLPHLDPSSNSSRIWVPCSPNFAAVDVILELIYHVGEFRFTSQHTKM